MYLTTIGGSAIIHLLAAHPKLVATFGIAAVVAGLATPIGPGIHAGQGGAAAAIERRLGNNGAAGIAAMRGAGNRAANFEVSSRERVQALLDETLKACGPGCFDLTSARVADDAALRRTLLWLHELDPLLSRRARPGRFRSINPQEVTRVSR